MKIRYKIASILFLSFFTASCSLDTAFLKPTKLSLQTAKMRSAGSESSDTTIIKFGANFQPSFTDSKQNSLYTNYSFESVLFRSRSGDTLNGWFIKPTGNTAPVATLLFLHGNAGNIIQQYRLMLPFVKRGYQVFVFDYSGFGFSQGQATWANALPDAESALGYVKARDDVKGTKLIIYGQSFGGHLSAVVATRNEAMIDGLVMEGAFSSPKDIAACAISPGIIGRIVVHQKYSALKSIKNYHKPLLVIHSSEDKTVPFFLGKKLYNAANSPKSFYEIRMPHINGPLYYADSISYKIKNMIVE